MVARRAIAPDDEVLHLHFGKELRLTSLAVAHFDGHVDPASRFKL